VTKNEANIKKICADLETQLRETQRELEYYRRIAQMRGKRHLSDVNRLSQLIARLQEVKSRLSESEEQYRTVIENISVGMMVIQDQKIAFANTAVSQFLGLSGEETLENSDPFVHVHPQDRHSALERHLKRIKGDALAEANSFRVVTKGSETKWVEVTGARIDWKGRPAVLNFFLDISERVQLEENRKKLEGQLLRAQKLEAIGTLAGGISHDFNNLMMGIQGSASIMLNDIDVSHPHYELLTNIEQLVRSGAKLTAQLLGYARKGRYVVRPLDLNQMVMNLTETFARTRKNILIRYQLSENLQAVNGDHGQLEQVLMNLLVNASDAMPTGGELILKSRNVSRSDITDTIYKPKSGPYVELTVTDTGIGMAHDIQERIFEPFFTTKELGRGTGLGLASVYGIVKGHHGYIDVQSRRGKGTTFTILLPTTGEKIHYPEAVSSPRIYRGKGVVLLVEDEEMVLKVGIELLKKMGYTALGATDGHAALEVFRANESVIDLVILDMILPGMGGGEVFERLRTIKPGLKVLISSGCDIDDHVNEVLEKGCSGFIQKPYTIEELFDCLNDILVEK